MKKYMFGLGKNSAENAKMLADMGYDAVVLPQGNAAAFADARDAGLEAYLCFGAFSLGEFSQETEGARDIDSNPAPWFDSGCPNSEKIKNARMDAAFDFAKNIEDLSGIFVDGARFASFASDEGADAFFTCFCEKCRAKMDKNLPREIKMLKNGQGSFDDMKSAFDMWLLFRENTIRAYMDEFSQRAHAIGIKSAAFVFAPSLGRFVGQTPKSYANIDIVAPMLYRDYPHDSGTACLGHEWRALRSMTKNMPWTNDIFGDNPLPENKNGFPSEYVTAETARAKAALSPAHTLAPIIQTEDGKLDITYKLTYDAGTDAVGEFMFEQKYDK